MDRQNKTYRLELTELNDRHSKELERINAKHLEQLDQLHHKIAEDEKKYLSDLTTLRTQMDVRE